MEQVDNLIELCNSGDNSTILNFYSILCDYFLFIRASDRVALRKIIYTNINVLSLVLSIQS